jgi:hypothetical protein
MAGAHFGAGFADAFSRIWGGYQQYQQQREELDLRKRDADLRGKMMDLQMEQLRRHIKSGELLTDLFNRTRDQVPQATLEQAAGQIEGEARRGSSLRADLIGAPVTYGPETPIEPFREGQGVDEGYPGLRNIPYTPERVPNPIDLYNPQDRLAIARAIGYGDPEAGAKLALTPPPMTLKDLLTVGRSFAGDYGNGGGIGMASPAEPPASTFVGGRLVQPPYTPALPSAAGAGPVDTGGGLTATAPLRPQLRFVPSVTLDANSQPRLTVNGQLTNFHIDEHDEEYPQGSGQNVRVRVLSDPVSGQQFRQIVGASATPDEMRTGTKILGGWGMKADHPLFNIGIGKLLEIAKMPSEMHGDALAALEDWATGEVARSAVQGPGARATTPPSTRSLLEGSRQRRAQEAEQQERMKEQVKRQEQPIPAADLQRLVQLKSVERQANFMLDTFNPNFVGKGFGSAIRDEFNNSVALAQKGKYEPGAIAGWIRTFRGTASDEEVQFRRSLGDMLDQMVRIRTGAQVNQQELASIQAFVASLTDEPSVFRAGVRRLRNEVGSQIIDVLQGATTPAATELRQREQARDASRATRTPEAAQLRDSVVDDLTAGRIGLDEARTRLRTRFPEKWVTDFLTELSKQLGGTR